MMAGFLARRRLARFERHWADFIENGRCQECGATLVDPPDNEFVRCANGHPYDSAGYREAG